MELSAGSKLGSYEILARIGAGEKGEVYQARDMCLGREVAIKVLPQRLAEKPQAWQRFEREARTLSRLNHPHICMPYDIGHYNGITFLVMEHLEGETLAARLERGSLKTKELLAIAIQVAGALDRAHREGVIHGDLKPGNIMLTSSGAKLLDFGLANYAAPVEGDLAASPAVGQLPAAAGTISGTTGYLSPEQLEGKAADARSDIFAFGTVLYEMAAGKQAFRDESRGSVIAAIREREPEPIPAREGESALPPEFDRLLRACLAKDPDDRFQSAHDLRLELEGMRADVEANAAPAATIVRSRNRERVAWLVALAAVAVATAMVMASLLQHAKPAPAPRIKATLILPAGLALSSANSSIAFSPDGKELAIAAADADGNRHLWLRDTESSAFAALPGTVGATYPFWSPDGRSIAFFADHQLKRIDLATGSVFTICAATDGRGGTWNRQGTIVFAPLPFGGLYRVPAAGGTPIQVSVPESASMTERLPHFLPGGRRLLFYAGMPGASEAGGIYLFDLQSGKSRLLLRADSEARYVEPGYLAFVRGGNLMVERFDPATLRLSDQPLTVARGVSFNRLRATGEYAFSSGGLLVYEPSTPVPESRLTWFSLDGRKLGTVGEPAPFVRAAVSPGGNEAVAQAGDGMGHFPLWIYDLKRGSRRRFTNDAGSFHNPLWSPDGRQIVYEDGLGDLFLKAANGASPAKQILAKKGRWHLSSWSPDGLWLALQAQSNNGWDIWLLPMRGEQKPRAFLATPFNEYGATFSASGRWISYLSDESGRTELYVMPFPGQGAGRQISSDGAQFGGWVPGLPELAYVTPEDRLMIVKVKTQGKNLQVDKPRVALGGRPFPAVALPAEPYTAETGFFSPNGKKLLLPVPTEKNRFTTLTLVTNWRAGLARE